MGPEIDPWGMPQLINSTPSSKSQQQDEAKDRESKRKFAPEFDVLLLFGDVVLHTLR